MTIVGKENPESTPNTAKGEDVGKTAGEVHENESGSTQSTNDKNAETESANIFDDIKNESVANSGDVDKDIERASALPGKTANIGKSALNINGENYDASSLIITPEEKAAFIDSLITGKRYTQTMSLFGGRMSVVIRSRTANETHAMYAYIRHLLYSPAGDTAESKIEGDMAYVPLVAQVAEVNGTSFPEMKAPYTYEESGGEVKAPGWYDDFLAWKKKPEGLTSALISCVQLFEYKYWTMVKEASNKNFWKSDTSSEA